jgi:hypothetical protein
VQNDFHPPSVQYEQVVLSLQTPHLLFTWGSKWVSKFLTGGAANPTLFKEISYTLGKTDTHVYLITRQAETQEIAPLQRGSNHS